MSTIKLRKILAREENFKAINDIVKAMKIKIAIEDNQGTIYGSNKDLSLVKRYDIKLQDNVIGWILGDENASCITAVLNSMVVNEMDKKRLADETLEKYKEINMLYSVSEKIASAVGISNVAKIVIAEAMKYINSTCATIMLLNEEGDKLDTVCELNKNVFIEQDGMHKLKACSQSSIIKNTITNKTGGIFNNLAENYKISIEECSLYSIICAPIAAKNKIIGVMVLGSEKPAEYTAADLKLSNSLAFQAGTAIESAKLYESLRENFFDMIQVLSQIVEMKDNHKIGHTQRVINYCMNIARAIGLPKTDAVKLKLAAMLHDIGNVAISEELLNKKGKFKEEEFGTVKKHSEIGANMLGHIDQLKDIIPIIKAHHERYDGTGYPDGKKGEEIPLISRIIAVADAFEAMTNDRPYREALSMYFAAEELLNNKNTQFDPLVIDTFFKIYKDKNLEEIQNYVYTV